jgi:hypothetical protein
MIWLTTRLICGEFVMAINASCHHPLMHHLHLHFPLPLHILEIPFIVLITLVSDEGTSRLTRVVVGFFFWLGFHQSYSN